MHKISVAPKAQIVTRSVPIHPSVSFSTALSSYLRACIFHHFLENMGRVLARVKREKEDKGQEEGHLQENTD